MTADRRSIGLRILLSSLERFRPSVDHLHRQPVGIRRGLFRAGLALLCRRPCGAGHRGCIEEVVDTGFISPLTQRLGEFSPRSALVLGAPFQRGEPLVHPGCRLLVVLERAVCERPEAQFRVPLDEHRLVALLAEEFLDLDDPGGAVCRLLHQFLSRFGSGSPRSPRCTPYRQLLVSQRPDRGR